MGCLAQVTPGQLEHMGAMLSLQPGAAPRGQPFFSDEALRTGLRDCAELSTAALAGRPAALAALDNMSACISADLRGAWVAFLGQAGAPLTGEPELGQRQLARLLSDLGRPRVRAPASAPLLAVSNTSHITYYATRPCCQGGGH